MKKNTKTKKTGIKNIVVFGGGTGSSTILKGLIKLPNVHITSVVAAFDDGGSGGALRQQLKVLPPGDPRVCLAATSPYGKLLDYRFQDGDLRGHTIGNIIIAGLEKQKGTLSAAMQEACKLFECSVTILPITEEQAHLFVIVEDGSIVRGEDTISDFPPPSLEEAKVTKVDLTPKPKANPLVLEAIAHADLILIAPSDLYASCLANFITKGIAHAIQQSKAKKAYVCNLFTKWGHLHYKATDFVSSIEKYFTLDVVLVNTGKPSKRAVEHYKKHKQYLVEDDTSKLKGKTIMRDNFVDELQEKQNPVDSVPRSRIRHRYDKVAKIVSQLLP